LNPGESGTVDRLDLPPDVHGKMLELGLSPGENVRLIRRAPFGDPIEIEVLGYRIAIRASEASQIYLHE
jgi:ferrous iron transport protein A